VTTPAPHCRTCGAEHDTIRAGRSVRVVDGHCGRCWCAEHGEPRPCLECCLLLLSGIPCGGEDDLP
jgi:hypothetical protein